METLKIERTATITIETNYGGKLAKEEFVHITFAPPRLISESEGMDTIFIIKTKDGSHPPVRCHLVDLCRFELYQAHREHTQASHGMTPTEFVAHMDHQYKLVSIRTPMAAYYYQKIKE